MKLLLMKSGLRTMDDSFPYEMDRVSLEGHELEDMLRDCLARFIAGTLDPDLQGISPDKFISNLMNGRFGDFSNRYMIIAKADGKAVGILIGMLNEDKALHIYSVHVLPEYREKGVASAMLIRCNNDMFERHIDSLLIDVHMDNFPAVNLYKKFGFRAEDMT